MDEIRGGCILIVPAYLFRSFVRRRRESYLVFLGGLTERKTDCQKILNCSRGTRGLISFSEKKGGGSSDTRKYLLSFLDQLWNVDATIQRGFTKLCCFFLKWFVTLYILGVRTEFLSWADRRKQAYI